MIEEKKKSLVIVIIFGILMSFALNIFYLKDDFIRISDYLVLSLLVLNLLISILKYNIKNIFFNIFMFLSFLYFLISTSISDEPEFGNGSIRILDILGLNNISENVILLFLYLHLSVLVLLFIIEIIIVFGFIKKIR
jgi:hypothetical protein